MPPQVIARYPGIDVAREFAVSWGWGIRPETHTIETTVNHPPTADFGTFSLIELNGDGKRLDLYDCRVVRTSYPGDGRLVVHFEDFRWTWATGSIDGDYNYFDPLTLTYRRPTSARELAVLLLGAMEVTRYNVDALPTDAYPRKQWNAANPAQELELLGAEFGLVVAADPVDRRVSLCRIGQGAELPEGPAMRRLPAVSAAPIPSQIRVIGGTALFQTAFTIGRPFAREIDGRLVPLDSVSYKPAGGWSSNAQSPWTFNNLGDGSTVINGERVYHRDLAQESVWRYYELGLPESGWTPAPLVGSPYAPLGMEDMGPFLDTRLEKDSITDARLPIVVRGGNYFEVVDSYNKSVNGEWKGQIQFVDPERPIFRTSMPLFRYAGTNMIPSPAQGIVVVGHACRKFGVQLRYEKWLDNTVPTPAGPLLEYHDDMVREYVSARSTNGGLGNGPATDNVAKCDAQADYHLDALAASLAPVEAGTIQTTGLYLGRSLDGAIRRLVWSGGVNLAPSTTVARNNEPNPFVTPYERRPSIIAAEIAKTVARRARANEITANIRAGIK